ncbi:hypothetical protein B0H10DRAFT_2217513 [Mycena sp. CBHHK59/15]|nr:hypothetical protein B0H10DRAFT_2217513 [Mycena sp. CBHHK59/15]
MAAVELTMHRAPEEDARLIAQLMVHCTHHRKGIRATNIAASVDSRAVGARIQEELTNLYERTGTLGFALLTRGNMDDPFIPTFSSSGDAIDFWQEVLRMHALRKFNTTVTLREVKRE